MKKDNTKNKDTETPKRKRASNKRYDIEIIEEDGTKRIFRTLTEANAHYGLRKDYLNYCFSEKYKHYLTKNGLSIKSIRRLTDPKEAAELKKQYYQ